MARCPCRVQACTSCGGNTWNEAQAHLDGAPCCPSARAPVGGLWRRPSGGGRCRGCAARLGKGCGRTPVPQREFLITPLPLLQQPATRVGCGSPNHDRTAKMMLHLLLPLVSARGQAADGSMGPDLSTHGSRRPALDYRPEVGGVAMSRPSTLPPPPDRGGPPPLPATGSPEPGKAWKSFAVGRQRVHQSSRLTGGSRETRMARGPKASGAFEGLGLGRRRRRQRGAKRRDVPVSALARIPLAKARMTANQPAAADTLAAIRRQVSGSPSPSPLPLTHTPSPSPSRSLILSPCYFCPRPTLTCRATGKVAARLRA